MIGVVVPAHNEEDLIERCLLSVRRSTLSPRLRGEPVAIVVVADACTDRTAVIAARYASVVTVDARNVGVARANGVDQCLKLGCRWLAFTDADTEVSEDWIADQLLLDSDAVCGTVGISDWGSYGDTLRSHFARTYTDADGHRHIHGANLGVSAVAYERAGGFKPLRCSEDVALVKALQQVGATISWSALPRVWTSARRNFRAEGGFGAALLQASLTSASPTE